MYKNYILREEYFNRVSPYIGKSIIKVFTGQRRVGKSYLMYQIMDHIKQQAPDTNIIYIDKEQHEFDHINTYNDLLSYIISKTLNGKNAIFIDEIQEIISFEKALRSIYSNTSYDIYCTGSNANMLSGELATFLSGRYVEIEVHSLSYLEYLQFHKKANSTESLYTYLKYGGLPNLIHLEMEETIVFDYLKNIYTSILFRDVIKRHNIRNVTFLENLVVYLCDNVGSVVSGKKISDFLKSQNIKISPGVVLDYLTYLSNSFFIYKTQRRDIHGKKIFEIGEKYFFEDLGLRNSIVGYKITDIQKLMENVVHSHLRFKKYDVKIGVLDQYEIDFVAEKSGEKTYVQVCYLLQEQSTIDREFGNLLKIKDQYPKIVVSMDEFSSTSTYQGVQHYSLKEFLSNF